MPLKNHTPFIGRHRSDDANFRLVWETKNNNDTTCLNGVFLCHSSQLRYNLYTDTQCTKLWIFLKGHLYLIVSNR